MLLLRISDIQFRNGVCNTPMDPDLPYRTALIQDARGFVNNLDPDTCITSAGHRVNLSWKIQKRDGRPGFGVSAGVHVRWARG